MPGEFVPAEVVGPLLVEPRKAALRATWGSDVLGYDTARSTDHGGGPRLQVFVVDTDVTDVSELLAQRLPKTFRGWPVHFGWDRVEPRHHVEVTTLSSWLRAQVGSMRRSRDRASTGCSRPSSDCSGSWRVVCSQIRRDNVGETR